MEGVGEEVDVGVLLEVVAEWQWGPFGRGYRSVSLTCYVCGWWSWGTVSADLQHGW